MFIHKLITTTVLFSLFSIIAVSQTWDQLGQNLLSNLDYSPYMVDMNHD